MGHRNPWLLNRRLSRDLSELERRGHTITYSPERKSERHPVQFYIDDEKISIKDIHSKASEYRRKSVLTKNRYELQKRIEDREHFIKLKNLLVSLRIMYLTDAATADIKAVSNT